MTGFPLRETRIGIRNRVLWSLTGSPRNFDYRMWMDSSEEAISPIT